MIVGLDEVGRGCWAGPLVAGAVLLRVPIEGLRDSKKLSKQMRERLAIEIKEKAAAYGLGWISPQEVDALGLTAATGLAMERALDAISLEYDELIIDGNYNFFPGNQKARAIVRADDSVPAVSAASIIAKVARDDYMIELSKTYPAYGFDKHVGYGTAAHRAMLKLHGVSDVHRLSYKPVKAFMVGVN